MKELFNLFSILGIIFMFNSCGSPSENIKEESDPVLNLEELALAHLKSNNDLATAEYLGMDVLDTMFNRENINREKIIYSRALVDKEVRITKANTAIKMAQLALEANPNDVQAQKAQQSAMRQKANIESSQQKVDSLEATLKRFGGSSVSYYEVLMKYSRKNEEGKAVPENYGLRIGRNGEILHASLTKRRSKK